MTLKTSIEKLMRKENLDRLTCQDAVNEILDADANSLQIAAFLVLLRSKTETPEELAGMIAGLKQRMIPVSTKHKVMDIVGTGGDGAGTVNISTGSAILAASCGVKIAKHGNRAATSLAGSADVLEAFGIEINLTPKQVSASIDEIGIGFCFYPNFHPAICQLGALRKQLNVPTTFNILGSLLNPANPAHFLLGVFDESLLRLMAEALQKSGTERSIIVHGCGLDEISCLGPAKVVEVTQMNIKESIIDPEQLGFSLCTLADLRGGNAKTNAQLLLNVFSGENSSKSRAIADTLILNAAMALYLYGLHPSLSDAIDHAKNNLHEGSALKLLNKWKEFSHD
ncbi:MAG: anthranilate phosphoribosyltransferase [Legionellales bacterium]|nr:anthranilate phosphoribosyltransferase [Legionellales bacterium]